MGGGGISGRVRALNLTVPFGSGRVGSDDLGYGPGSGFSFEPVQTSSQSMWLNQFCSQTTPYLLLDFPLPAFSLLHANQIRGPELTII